MLESLGFSRWGYEGREQVAILVGPNGAGKSNFLRGIASDIRYSRNLAVICNTAYDRFSGMRGIKRISASRAGRSPKTVVKLAVGDTLHSDDSRFYQIAKILEHCGYRPTIGFKVELKGRRKYLDTQALLDAGEEPHDIEMAASFFERFDPYEIVWVGGRGRVLDYSQGREFASVLRLEGALRKQGYLRDIQVYLERIGGPIIELLSASSGELSLISSLLFLIANRDEDPVVLVDEPENSLHPSWQREYVDKLLAALEYRGATVVIATHSPLVVTGALSTTCDLISVFHINQGSTTRINLSGSAASPESIEAVLWRAFDVITPASHYVSEELVSVVTQLEQGMMDAEVALARVDAMDVRSFDQKQHAFFEAVRELITKVEAQREEHGTDA
ncbi:MAG TPA: AAA family ATPase [Allosphingosinicella sp.]|jgi:predicted ATPase